MTNRVALNSNTYHGFSLEQALEGARRTGIQFIELAAVPGWTEHVSVSMTDLEVEQLLTLLEISDIRAIALGGHSNLLEASGRAHFRANLQLAHRLGVEYVVTGTGETHGDEALVEDEGALEADLRELALEASALGLSIAIETHGANYDTGMKVAALVDRVGASNLGVAYDTANVVFYGDIEPYDDLEATAGRVVGLHLKDKAGANDEWNFPAIGDGTLDFKRIANILDAANCTAPLSIEIEFTPDGPGGVERVHEAVVTSVATIARTMGR